MPVTSIKGSSSNRFVYKDVVVEEFRFALDELRVLYHEIRLKLQQHWKLTLCYRVQQQHHQQQKSLTTSRILKRTLYLIFFISIITFSLIFLYHGYIIGVDNTTNLITDTNFTTVNVNVSCNKNKFFNTATIASRSTILDIDDENKIMTLLLKFHNICFSKDKIHFFNARSSSSNSTSLICNGNRNKKNSTLETAGTCYGTTTKHIVGLEAMQFFEQIRKNLNVITFLQRPLQHFEPHSVLHNTSMEEWINNNNNSTVTFFNGTSFISPPGLPNNNFHIFNDLIIPRFRDVILSGTRTVDDYLREKKKMNNGDVEPINLFLLKSNTGLMNRRVIMYDVLLKIFDEVHYPFENFFKQQEQQHFGETKDSGESLVCFDRYIWSQGDNQKGGEQRPFYKHAGRFDEYHDNQWKGIVPALRDIIYKAYDIETATSTIVLTEKWRGKEKPTLVWASRTYGAYSSNRCERCIANEGKLLDSLRIYFRVELLPIFDRITERDEHLVTALKLMAEADILGGLHGAGLGHAVLLKRGSLLFEIKDRTHFLKNLFLNIANHNDLGYYAFDAQPFEVANSMQRFYLSDEAITTIVGELWAAWEKESERRLSELLAAFSNYSKTLSVPANKEYCQFPLFQLSGKLSPFNASRCYLVQNNDTGQWDQVVDFPLT